MPSIPTATKTLTLCLCILLVGGAWVPLVTTDRENTTAEADPAWKATTTGTRTDGNGTKDNPFLIYTVEDLQAMKDNQTAHYALANDIDASATKDWNGGAGFEPVGKDSNNRFTGSLDGRGYKITGLYINRGSTNYVGLFGYIGTGGTLTNVGFVDADVTGHGWVGGFAGAIWRGSVTNCYATGSVTGEHYVGGLVGYNDGSVSDSYATGSVSGTEDVGGLMGRNGRTVSDSYATGSVTGTRWAGGLAGKNFYGSVSNSYATGSVTGNKNIGGLVGENDHGSVSDSYATGSVSGNEGVGGFVGENGGSVSNSYATGSVTAIWGWVGGFVGRNGGSVSDSYATGSVTGRPNGPVGGFVGLNGGSVSNSHYNIDAVRINDEHLITLGGLFQDQYRDWFENSWTLNIADYSTTLVPSGDHYEISGVDGLRHLLGFAHIAGLEFRLTSDIDLSTAPGLYIPFFAAKFDGNGYRILNLQIDLSFVSGVGLFGHVASGGSVSNVGLVDVDVFGEHFVGGLVGRNAGSVSNCYATGSVYGWFIVGGLVGRSSGLVNNSYATGSVTATHPSGLVGGLVGINSGSVLNCYASGSVTGHENVGGLVGVNDKGSIENCFYDRMTTGCSDTGKGTPKTTAEMKTRSTFTGAGWDIVSFSNRDARNSEYTWNIVDGATYPFLSWEDVSHDDDHGGIRAIHVGLAFIVLFIAVAVFLFVKKNSPQARNGTPERAEIEPHPVLVPDSSFAPPPDYRPPPPEEDPPAPESFPPPMEPTPEQTGERVEELPDDGPPPSSTAPAGGAFSTPDLPASLGVTPLGVELSDQPVTTATPDHSVSSVPQSCPGCGKEVTEEEPSCPECGYRKDG